MIPTLALLWLSQAAIVVRTHIVCRARPSAFKTCIACGLTHQRMRKFLSICSACLDSCHLNTLHCHLRFKKMCIPTWKQTVPVCIFTNLDRCSLPCCLWLWVDFGGVIFQVHVNILRYANWGFRRPSVTYISESGRHSGNSLVVKPLTFHRRKCSLRQTNEQLSETAQFNSSAVQFCTF